MGSHARGVRRRCTGARSLRRLEQDRVELAVEYAQSGGVIVGVFERSSASGAHNPDIYLVNADGSGLTALAETPGFEAHPSWSPDGSEIVYDVYPPGTGEGRFVTVWVMNADGSGKVQLTKGSVKGGTPSWSPDGKQIVFMRDVLQPAERWVMYVVRPDGSGLRRVTRPPSQETSSAQPDEYFPTWTSSSKLLFLKLGDIFVVNPDGSGLKRLTKGLNAINYALSPDDKRLVVQDGTGRVALVPANGSGATTTLSDSVADYTGEDPWASLVWTPDGKAVTLASSEFYGEHGSRVYLIPTDGSAVSAVKGVEHAVDPAWRPE